MHKLPVGGGNRGAEVDEGDNMTLGTQSWGLQPGGVGGKLEGSPFPDVILGKCLEGASSLHGLWEPCWCLLWALETLELAQG